MFHYNKKCLKSCSEAEVSLNYYIKKKDIESEDGEENNDDETENDEYKDYQCIDKCPSGYYIYNDMCVKKCPHLSEKKYIDHTKKECTTCNIGEGFIRKADSEEQICAKSCEIGEYYEKGDNMCKKFSSDGETCYFPEDNYGVCYPSCNDIEPKDIYKYVNKHF